MARAEVLVGIGDVTTPAPRPRLLDERSKELLREFGKINAEPVRE